MKLERWFTRGIHVNIGVRLLPSRKKKLFKMELPPGTITIDPSSSAAEDATTRLNNPPSTEAERPTVGAVHGDVIPESLLALAKDSRYIRQCQELLEQVWQSLLGGRQSHPSEQSALERRTWLLSYLLYVLFVVAPSGRSLGMQLCGLNFDDAASGGGGGGFKDWRGASTTQRLRFVGYLLMTAAAGFGLEYCASMRCHDDDGNDGSSAAGRIRQERLRGNDRRQMHERLRRQMMERAGGVPSMTGFASDDATVVHSNQRRRAGHGTIGSSSPPTGSQTSSLSRRLLSLLRRLSKSVLDASFHPEGPHFIMNGRDGSSSDSSNSYFSMARWLIRLHLAHYLVTGRFPTLLHRFLGLQSKRDGPTSPGNSPNASILVRPNVNRAIAGLILLQASASAMRATSNWLAARVADYLESQYPSARTDETEEGVPSVNAQLDVALSKCFGHPSAVVDVEESVSRPNGAKLSPMADGSVGASSSGGLSRTVCAICRTDRTHPAAPSSCGHVCCWDCLMHWVSTVRPECPMCRAPCRPQDVIALYHYEPSPSSVDDA